MRNRPAVLVKAVDRDGTIGWGEAWCNFPTVGAEHRARLINEVCAELICDKEWQGPQAVFGQLTHQLHILALQSAEPGPIAQAIAGIDIALWDLAAKKAARPLYKYIGDVFGQMIESQNHVPCYASGINPDQPEQTARALQEQGHTSFKFKVGFEDALDLRNMKAMRKALGEETTIMIDANQGWDFAKARERSKILGEWDRYWLEEPLAADRPAEEWQALSEASPIPLAGGENLRGDAFAEACRQNYFKFIQPDVAKWGGISGCFTVAMETLNSGKIYCPHYLGGGIGLIASAHLLASAGGSGFLEVDCNPNPLKEQLADPFPVVTEGRLTLPQEPGLGVEPDLDRINEFRTL